MLANLGRSEAGGHQAAIELRRMVDPNWTFTSPPPAGVDHTPPAWTLDLKLTLTLPGQRLEILHAPQQIPAIPITRTNAGQVIEIEPTEGVDGNGAAAVVQAGREPDAQRCFRRIVTHAVDAEHHALVLDRPRTGACACCP